MSKAAYTERLDALVTLLEEIAPTRMVTRTYRDFSQRRQEDLEKGIFTVVSGGVREYPSVYEPGDEGRQRIFIIFQGQVAEKAEGPELEEAEFEAMNELETLAEQAPLQIPTLVIQSAETSTQLEAPYCWVRSTWETFTDPRS